MTTGRTNRNRGKRWERELVHLFRPICGEEVRRGWQSRQGDDEADVEGVPLLWVEAKHKLGGSVRAAMRQATQASAVLPRRRPLAVVKSRKHQHWADKRRPLVIACLWRDEFKAFVKQWVKPLAYAVDPPEIYMRTVTGKRANVYGQFVTLGQEAGDAVAILEVCDEGQRPFVVMELDAFLSIYGLVYDAILATLLADRPPATLKTSETEA